MQVDSVGLAEKLVKENHTFLPNLDFVRSIAVILVVIGHTLLAVGHPIIYGWDLSAIGLFGVWIFFVHTACVLMWSLERKPFTLDFYIRRVFRIYPLALVAIAVALITRAPLLGDVHHYFGYAKTSAGNLFATSLLAYNLVPPNHHYHQIVNVMWTLPLEVDMYLVLPVLFAFVQWESRLWPLLLLWGLATANALVSFRSTLNFASSIPDFLAGVIAYVGFARYKARIPAWIFPVFLALLLAVCIRSFRYSLAWPFALLLGLAIPHFRQFGKGIFAMLCNRVARYSYGIYLVHPFALVLAVYCLPGKSILVQVAVEIVTIAAGSFACYHLIEKPMIDLGSRIAARTEISAIKHGSDQSLVRTA